MTDGQQPPDRPVAQHSSITEPSWLPRQNSLNSGYCSHEESKLGSSEFTDDDHLSPVNVPEAVVSLVSCEFASAVFLGLIRNHQAARYCTAL